MRTIIINTLDKELPKNELFFLPFRDDQLSWLDVEMGGIGSCAEQIEALYKAQDKHQDYRLVVLVDLAGYYDIDDDGVNSCYQRLLRAYINRKLLYRLTEQCYLPPKDVTILFMATRKSRGAAAIVHDKILDHILGFSEECIRVEKLQLTKTLENGEPEQLDLTDLFQVELDIHTMIAQRRQEEGKQETKASLVTLRENLTLKLEKLQQYEYVPAGWDKPKVLPTRVEYYEPRVTSPALIWADLQLNLSEFLAKQVLGQAGQSAGLDLKAHTLEELAFCVARGNMRVRYLLREAPVQTYYPVENGRGADLSGLSSDIWTALLEKEDLIPGVKEAKTHAEGRPLPDEETLIGKLRRTWIRVDQEKAQFQALCSQLEAEYNEETAKEQQTELLNICAEEFRRWRGGALRRNSELSGEPTLTIQPEYDPARHQQKLQKIQEESSRIAAEKLEDYQDVRQEAEEVKADFRKAGRVWSPDAGQSMNNRYFLLYSLAMAGLFILQMMLPYVGITMGQSGVEISRYAHFIISLVVFAALYMVGVLFWLRRLCEELHECSARMRMLIIKSIRRRRESIEEVVNAYGSVLPQCTIAYENLRELDHIHKLNNARREHYHAHVNCLKRAEELLRELGTQLRLPMPDEMPEKERLTKGIDYQRPPSDGCNLSYYLLLSDEWGETLC